jgi:hypothetical protein
MHMPANFHSIRVGLGAEDERRPASIGRHLQVSSEVIVFEPNVHAFLRQDSVLIDTCEAECQRTRAAAGAALEEGVEWRRSTMLDPLTYYCTIALLCLHAPVCLCSLSCFCIVCLLGTAGLEPSPPFS